jgi:hypothetical protein
MMVGDRNGLFTDHAMLSLVWKTWEYGMEPSYTVLVLQNGQMTAVVIMVHFSAPLTFSL